MTPGTRVAVERTPCVLPEHAAADPITGRSGTVINTPPDDRFVHVAIDGLVGPRTIHRDQLTILTTPTNENTP